MTHDDPRLNCPAYLAKSAVTLPGFPPLVFIVARGEYLHCLPSDLGDKVRAMMAD
jgi:hypothetical protein